DEDVATIMALCDAYIKKISELIKKRFDDTNDGMSLNFDENDQLILNGMNIHAFVEQCRINPNPKSIIFLKGIKTRLELVLERKTSSRNYVHIKEVIMVLFDQIKKIIKEDD
ncbi:hypothetical protein BVY03_01065, partial [bacterium K02(2017)]